jgi:uncharacterized protein (TIRG00374 family)
VKRTLRVVATIVVTGLAVAYLIWKIDVGKSADILANADPWYLALAVVISIVMTIPMAWRWQLLLDAKGVHDGLHWLTRAYFVSYLAGQVLPTSVGGDAVRSTPIARAAVSCSRCSRSRSACRRRASCRSGPRARRSASSSRRVRTT